MPPTPPRTELKSLKRFIKELETRYLTEHLGRRVLGPIKRKEELDVAAFSVLAHGALENFVEGIALWGLTRIEDSWILRMRASKSTAALMMHTEHKFDHRVDRRSVFDQLRGAIDSAKNVHSGTIEDNNGAEVRHMRTLLAPIGVDVPQDPILTASLDTLVRMRHQWAHQYRFGAKTSKSAKDALTTARTV